MNSPDVADPTPIAETGPLMGVLQSLESANGWINSGSRTASNLHGHVVLVEFWTYSCINWLRTFPYVRAWAKRYGRDGFVVVGVHSPEFPFEHDLDNVRRAVRELGVEYPVAIDNDFAIWRAFDNEYWPAMYLIDPSGRVRYRHFGEGDYDRTESAIRNLLTEAGTKDVGEDRAEVRAGGIEAPADWEELESPETYVGYERGGNSSSPEPVVRDKAIAYSLPARLPLNHWALGGSWIVKARNGELVGDEGRIAYSFHARDLNLVLGPAPGGKTVRFRVLLDGRPPGDARGVDVDSEGYGSLAEPRLYQLIRQQKPIADRRFEIEFYGSGAAAYSFTFG